MKKFLAIAAIAATFTACNDEKKAEDAPKVDSPAVTAPVAPKVDSAVKAATDTAAAKMQTAVDSTASKMKAEVKKP